MKIEKTRRVEPVEPPPKVADKPRERELPKPMPAKRKKAEPKPEEEGRLDEYA